MKINQNTVVRGEKVSLVPYESYHVPKYHEWMKSEELQQLTASEPLSLQEEFAMQRSWREDDNKCTFIVVDKSKYETLQKTTDKSQQDLEIECMVGDVNLFFLEDRHAAEVEIMIAEPYARGQGRGREALCSMMRYGHEELGVKKFVAKVGLNNQPSLRLFASLQFTQTSVSEVFQETTMEVEVNKEFIELLQSFTSSFHLSSHTTASA